MKAEQQPKEDDGNSFSSIYRVLRILGSASVITTALSLLRNKAFAVLLGPIGFGMVTLFNSILSVAGNLGGLGIGYSATRIISGAYGRNRRSQGDRAKSSFARLGRKLALVTFFGTMLSLAIWIASAGWGHFDAISIVAISAGAAFSIMASVNTTLLQIRRNATVLAIVSVTAAAFHTALAIWLAKSWGSASIALIVAVVPMTLWIASEVVLRGDRSGPGNSSSSGVGKLQVIMVSRGIALMLPGVLESASAFLIRALGVFMMGLAAVGNVFAAFAISSFILSAVMTAMNQDFYPRVCEAAGRRQPLYGLASEQLTVTIQLSAPILILLSTFSTEITNLLLSPAFSDASRLIPLMAVLVIASIASWPIHVLQTALGLARHQVIGGVANAVATLALIAAFRGQLNPFVFSVAMLVGSLSQFAVQAALLRRDTGIAYRARDFVPMALLVAAIAVVAVLKELQEPAKMAGGVLALCWSIVALRHYVTHGK